MNLLLLRSEELGLSEAASGNFTVRIDGRRALHIQRVLKTKVGQRLRVGVARTAVGTAEVLDWGSDTVLLGAFELEERTAKPQVSLILALPRPKALRRILQTAASFGVAEIHLVNAWRVDKSYWGSPIVETAAMEEELQLGCEQGRHVWLPTVYRHRLLMPFLEEWKAPTGAKHLIAHPGGDQWLKDHQPLGPTVLAIGPEGGWITSELNSFVDRGFELLCISTSILRSEIALASVLAQWQMLNS